MTAVKSPSRNKGSKSGSKTQPGPATPKHTDDNDTETNCDPKQPTQAPDPAPNSDDNASTQSPPQADTPGATDPRQPHSNQCTYCNFLFQELKARESQLTSYQIIDTDLEKSRQKIDELTEYKKQNVRSIVDLKKEVEALTKKLKEADSTIESLQMDAKESTETKTDDKAAMEKDLQTAKDKLAILEAESAATNKKLSETNSQLKQAQEDSDKQKQLYEADKRSLQAQISQRDTDLKTSQSEANKYKEELKGIQDESMQLKNELKHITDTTKSTKEKAEKEVAEYAKQLQTLQNELASSKTNSVNETERLKTELEKKTAEMELAAESREKELNQKLIKSENEIQAMKATLNATNDQKAKLMTQLEEQTKLVETLKASYEEKDKLYQKVSSENIVLNVEVNSRNAELDDMKQTVAKQQKQVAGLDRDLMKAQHDAQQIAEERVTEREKLEKTIREVSAALDVANTKYESERTRACQLEKELMELRLEYENSSAEINDRSVRMQEMERALTRRSERAEQQCRMLQSALLKAEDELENERRLHSAAARDYRQLVDKSNSLEKELQERNSRGLISRIWNS